MIEKPIVLIIHRNVSRDGRHVKEVRGIDVVLMKVPSGSALSIQESKWIVAVSSKAVYNVGMNTVVAELPDLYEVVNGQVVEKNVNVNSSTSGFDLAYSISAYSRPRKLGSAYTEVLIAMPGTFEHNRRPDIIYVSAETWPLNRRRPDDNAWEIVPDLCIEIVGPTDSAKELKVKIKEYFDAGVPMVWVVHPAVEQVEVFTSPKQSTILDRNDILRGDPVIPGFEMPLAELFMRDS